MASLGELKEIGVDLHLMVKEPADWIARALQIFPERIIGQVEMMRDAENFISGVIEGGAGTGIALDLETPVSVVSEEIYRSVDLILLLAVKAGFGGQRFDQRVVKKIEEIKKIVGDLVKVGVDGGLDEENIKVCQKKGANIFYVGGNFWEALNHNGSGQAEDVEKRYNELLQLISKS